MNSFGTLFRVSVFGESHGQCVGVLIDGTPAGMSLNEEDLAVELAKRRPGGALASPRKEEDAPSIMSGVFNGKTTGAPLLVLIENKDVDSSYYEEIRSTPRPGHADFTSAHKFRGFNDYRGGGHFSGRLTAGLVIAGAVAKKILAASNLVFKTKLVEAGGREDIQTAIQEARGKGDSIGGLVECTAEGLPVGLGEPFFDSVESLLSHAIFSIPAVKGIEFGDGFASARMHGSEYNDALVSTDGKTASNHAGGINGGLSNGNPMVFRVAFKPTSSIALSQKTMDIEKGELSELRVRGRHDPCIALRAVPVVECTAAIVLCDLMLLEQKLARK